MSPTVRNRSRKSHRSGHTRSTHREVAQTLAHAALSDSDSGVNPRGLAPPLPGSSGGGVEVSVGGGATDDGGERGGGEGAAGLLHGSGEAAGVAGGRSRGCRRAARPWSGSSDARPSRSTWDRRRFLERTRSPRGCDRSGPEGRRRRPRASRGSFGQGVGTKQVRSPRRASPVHRSNPRPRLRNLTAQNSGISRSRIMFRIL